MIGAGLRTLLSLIVAGFTVTVSAQTYRAGTWDFGFGLGPNFIQFDAVSDDLKSDWGFGLWIDRYFSEHWYVDLAFDWMEFDNSKSTHMNAYLLGVGYRFMPQNRWSPTVATGFGVGHAVDFPRATADQKRLTWHIRPGVDFRLTSRWKIGVAYEYAIIDLDNHAAKMAYIGLPLFTLSYHFGGGDEEPAPAPKPVAHKAAYAPVEPVDRDSDGDGIPDSRDQCPGTSAGTRVNGFGCVRGEKVQMQLVVHFATGKSEISPSSHAELARIADLLEKNPKASVRIEGHTDSVGSKALNMKLSDQRAKAVAKYLVDKFSLSSTRVKGQGYGPTKPVESNDTAEGRAKNRRVIAVFEPND